VEAGVIVTKYGHAKSTLGASLVAVHEAGILCRMRQAYVYSSTGRVGEGRRPNDLVLCPSLAAARPADPARACDRVERSPVIDDSVAPLWRDIIELNTVRKHLSQIKGGGLARMAAPATVVGLILSDVVAIHWK